MGQGRAASSNTVGRRALRFALGISLIFVAISSTLLFFYDYQAKRKLVGMEVESLRAAQSAGLSEALWSYDTRMLRALADGIGNYPYIDRVVVEDERGIVARSGSNSVGGAEISYPIVKAMSDGSTLNLGTLRLGIDSGKVLRDVMALTLPTIAIQLIFLVVESVIVLLLFSRMATRHLSTIASYISEYDVRPEAPPLRLRKADRGDELDLLVGAYNSMRKDVIASREAETRAMEGLRLSEERSRILVEEAPDAIMMYDLDAGVFIECNRRAEILFDRSRAELQRTKPSDLYVADPIAEIPLQESMQRTVSAAVAGEPVMITRRVLRPDGETIDCEVRLNRLPAEGRRVVRVSYLDVTERLRAEEAVARSLREKEVLIQEVYHRTKNNMQLIQAFLSLEAIESGDARVASAMEEMIGRIASMALVHQKLMDSKDLTRIDLGDYLRDLISSMKSAYLGERTGIGIEVQAESGIIAIIDLAVPCGLVLNELVSNALRHAFAGRREGHIQVSLGRGDTGTLRLAVSDDGSGFPAGFDFRRDGHIGLQTVVSIVEMQFRGSVDFSSGPGTTCTVVIRDDIYAARV